MKTLLMIVWALGIVLLNSFGELMLLLPWALLGWAFSGATSFVVYQAISGKGPKRSMAEQAGLVFIGMFMALLICKLQEAGKGIHPFIDMLLSLPAEVVAGASSAYGYNLFDQLQKRKLKDFKKDLETKPTPSDE